MINLQNAPFRETAHEETGNNARSVCRETSVSRPECRGNARTTWRNE